MKRLAIAVSILALALAACAERPRNNATGGATSEIKQDTQNAALTGKVKAALAADVGLRTLKIDVDSSGNTVTLNGVVDSEGTKRRAETVARGVDGVATVKNNLTVKSGG
jgi:osmotically-inducible protein OsmY